MVIAQLRLTQFRNLASQRMDFHPRCNLIVGANGSGKTSILEALHYLSSGKSFRTTRVDNLIQKGAAEFILFAQLYQPGQEALMPLGFRRPAGVGQQTEIRLAGERVTRFSDVAKKIPLQVITPESFRLFFDGPAERRRFVELGMFHVEQSYHANWLKAQRLLKQRNALLRTAGDSLTYEQLAIWDKPLSEVADRLTAQRIDYVQKLEKRFSEQLARLTDLAVQLQFKRGWPEKLTLAEQLMQQFDMDRQRRYTATGPHRFELNLLVDGKPVEQVLSRVQLKLVLFALKIAQSALMAEFHPLASCAVLVDDLPSELDAENRKKVANLLKGLPLQLFVTGIMADSLDMFDRNDATLFHVEQGAILQ